jgi:hypothetical protein
MVDAAAFDQPLAGIVGQKGNPVEKSTGGAYFPCRRKFF